MLLSKWQPCTNESTQTQKKQNPNQTMPRLVSFVACILRPGYDEPVAVTLSRCVVGFMLLQGNGASGRRKRRVGMHKFDVNGNAV